MTGSNVEATYEAGAHITKGDILRAPRRRAVPFGNVKSTRRLIGVALNDAEKGEQVRVLAMGTVSITRDEMDAAFRVHVFGAQQEA